MKRKLANLGIKYKLGLMAFLPTVGLLFFAYTTTLERYQAYDKMEKLEQLIELSIKLSSFVYEIQLERIVSVLHLRSADDTYVSRLRYEYDSTAESKQALQQFLATFDTNDYGRELANELDSVMLQLESLTDIRKKVQSRQVTADQSIQLHAELNTKILDFITQLANQDIEQSVLRHQLGYVDFLRGQEVAALERSLLTTVFSQQHFTPDQYRQFIELLTIQKVLFDRVTSLFFTVEQAKFYQNKLQGTFVQEVQRMKNIALAQDPEQIATVNPEHWSKMQTEKIEALVAVQKRLAQDLGQQAKHLSNHAYSDFIYILISVAVIVILSSFLFYFIWRGITLRLMQAVKISNAIKEGDLSSEITVDSSDETGNLLQSLQQMQTQLQKRAEHDKRIADEALRLTTALDTVTTSVMIIDNDFNIVYSNQSTINLLSSDAVKAQFPHLDSKKMLGNCVDHFHNDPSHQRKLINGLTKSYSAKFKVGDYTISSITTPIINQRGERIGAVAEWRDISAQVAIEKEINTVIQSASEGDFSQRIGLDDKTDFFHSLSAGINQIVEFNQIAVRDIADIFAALARGDLTRKIERNYRGELEQLKNDANATIAKLTESMTTIIRSARSVKSAAEELSQANLSLNQRTEEQASALEQTAASMQQMTSSVQQNADNAKQAAQLAINARDLADKGGEVVGNAIIAMSEISKSSREITDIIDVIDDIAFQTNLLALNAAVEAARAGEQGRGFAVVASEVRNLAQRSASAAKEIKNLIQDSVTRVNEGTKLVNNSGETLEGIVVGVKKVSDIISEISAASQEQSSGIHQVNKAVTQMDEMTQQNAAMVEEAASASESMAEQALILREQTDFFTINHELYEEMADHESNSSLHHLNQSTQLKPHHVPVRRHSNHEHRSTHEHDDDWEDF